MTLNIAPRFDGMARRIRVHTTRIHSDAGRTAVAWGVRPHRGPRWGVLCPIKGGSIAPPDAPGSLEAR
jgi:hypothetical protein